MQDLVEKVEQTLELARRAGADGAEVFVIDAPEDVVSFASAGGSASVALRTAETVPRRGLGLSAWWGGLVGFASTTDLRSQGLAEVVDLARAVAGPENPAWSLPPPSKPVCAGPTTHPSPGRAGASCVGGLVDRRLLEMSLPGLGEALAEVTDRVREAGATTLEAVALACCRRRTVGNSLGLLRSSLDTRIGAHVYAMSPGGGLGQYGRFSRSLAGLRAQDVGTQAARLALSSESARTVVSGRQLVVLRPEAVLSLLATSLGPALGADRVLDGRSPFKATSLGTVVAAPILTVIDDATRPAASGSYDFDDEGVAGQATLIIDKGRLSGFLHSRRSAARWASGGRAHAAETGEAATSTGNAARAMTGRMSTFVEPSGPFGYCAEVMPSNLVIQAPTATCLSLEALGADRGLVVGDVMGAFVIDAAVGDFSVTTANAWALERGRLTYPVKRAMLSGNVYSLLREVCALVEEPQDVAGSFSLLSPSWVVADLTVI
jgi:PmbA protein